MKEVVSLITSMESSDHSLSGSHHRNVTDILLRALPEKWSFRNLDRKEAKHKGKVFVFFKMGYLQWFKPYVLNYELGDQLF